MAVAAHIVGFVRGIEINVLKRPRSARDFVTRMGVVGAIVVAGFLPFLISAGGDSVADVAGATFRAALTELDTSREQLSRLRDDPTASAAQIAALEQRVEELEDRTFIGYIRRDGDAPKEGALVPDFRLLDLQGNPVKLSAIGKPTIVNFWASWCPFCIEEMPDLQRLQALVGDRAVVVGINRGESLSTARRFADSTGANYTLVLDLDDELGGRGGPYQIVGMPTTYYIRADGRIDTVKIGFQELDEMAELVGRLLGEEVALETEPVDTTFNTVASDLLASQRANHAVAAELFARLAADASVAEDIAWQRNVIAQTRAWSVNLDEFQALTAPA
ncbi:MAG: redoxin family protein, partial [Dehalococcoidia bacterium]